MTDLIEAAAACEQSRAEMRAELVDAASRYVLQLEATARAERRWAQDPDRDDLADAAKAARHDLDQVRGEFDKQRAAAAGRHTRRVKAVAAGL